jgi:transposase-like protein
MNFQMNSNPLAVHEALKLVGRKTYPVIAQSWRGNWSRVVPMFGYPGEIRRVIYTTNTIES